MFLGDLKIPNGRETCFWAIRKFQMGEKHVSGRSGNSKWERNMFLGDLKIPNGRETCLNTLIINLADFLLIYKKSLNHKITISQNRQIFTFVCRIFSAIYRFNIIEINHNFYFCTEIKRKLNKLLTLWKLLIRK